MNTTHTPLIKNDRLLFSGLFILGMFLCTFGIAKAPVYGWAHPISILGYIFGGLALLLGIQVTFRARILPVRSDRQAVYILLGIMAIKAVLAALYR